MSDLLRVLSVLEPTRYEQNSGLTDLDFKYRPNRLLYEYKVIFEGTGALKYFKLNFQIDHSEQRCVQKQRRLIFLMKRQVENEIQNLLEQELIETLTFYPKWLPL